MDELFSGLLNLTEPKKDPANVTRQERINMEGVAHAAKPEEMKEALLWYAKQPRKPGRSGNKRLLAQGRELLWMARQPRKCSPVRLVTGPRRKARDSRPGLQARMQSILKAS